MRTFSNTVFELIESGILIESVLAFLPESLGLYKRDFLLSSAIMSASSNSVIFVSFLFDTPILSVLYLLTIKVPSREFTFSKSTAPLALRTLVIDSVNERPFSSDMYKFPKGDVKP